MLYSLTTHMLTVSVMPHYLEELSDPSCERYVWSYNVRIENLTGETVRIINRTWKIIDACAREETTISPDTIDSTLEGMQPLLEPGATIEYSSQAHLSTSSGIIMGSYQAKLEKSNEMIEVAVPTFSLDIPGNKRLH